MTKHWYATDYWTNKGIAQYVVYKNWVNMAPWLTTAALDDTMAVPSYDDL